jgi:hypothetical protein
MPWSCATGRPGCRAGRPLDRRAVINAGDGWHQHPTQALLDAYTAAVGSATSRGRTGRHRRRHPAQRVARSTECSPSRARGRGDPGGTADPAAPQPRGLAVEVSHDLDAVLPTLDVSTCCACSASAWRRPSCRALREYTAGYGLTAAGDPGCARTRWSCTPGPMNRGVEIASRGADRPERRGHSTRWPTAWRCAWRCCSCCWARAGRPDLIPDQSRGGRMMAELVLKGGRSSTPPGERAPTSRSTTAGRGGRPRARPG